MVISLKPMQSLGSNLTTEDDLLRRKNKFSTAPHQREVADDDKEALLKVINILSNENRYLKEHIKSLSCNHHSCNCADVTRSSFEDNAPPVIRKNPEEFGKFHVYDPNSFNSVEDCNKKE